MRIGFVRHLVAKRQYRRIVVDLGFHFRQAELAAHQAGGNKVMHAEFCVVVVGGFFLQRHRLGDDMQGFFGDERGDFFDLTPNDLLNVNAVYDRASLVALPPEMRLDYTMKIRQLLPTGTHILLIAFEYFQ